MKKISLIFSAILLVCIMATVCFVACDKTDDVADNTKFYDAITKELTLNKSYEGKSFLTDGIGVAPVSAYTDGDTTRFVSGDNTVTIRYYCVDTPESTGGVQKWGKAASLFVKNQLSQATLIVLESSTGGKPVVDSYGSRYLGYVWYKTANDANLKNLNVELIENGFSENKAINTAAYPYYNVMDKANEFARSIKLRIYSDLDDPLFSTDPVKMTVKDFIENNESYYNEETDSGSRVEFDAYLESLSTSPSGTNTFTAVQYDPETGATYKIFVYAGYASYSASKMKLGHLYRIIGTIQKYNGNFQVSGVEYSEIYQDQQEGGSYILQKNYYLTFNSSVSYITQYSATLYSSVTVTSIEEQDGVLTIVGTANKCGKNGYSEESETFTFKANVPDGYSVTLKVGDKFSVNGYQLEANSHVITIPNIRNIVKAN